MKSFSIQGMKKHPALIPLVAIISVGMAGSMFYLTRLATRNPDVSWNKKEKLEPWQEYATRQYKFWSSKDFKEIPKPERPQF